MYEKESDSSVQTVKGAYGGDGVMSFDGEEVSVAAGDAVLVPEGVDHGLRNTGDAHMKLVIVWGPPMTEDRLDI